MSAKIKEFFDKKNFQRKNSDAAIAKKKAVFTYRNKKMEGMSKSLDTPSPEMRVLSVCVIQCLG